MKAKHVILSVAVCFAASGPACARHSPKPKPSPNSVYKVGIICAAPCITLIGDVKHEINYGPPGFGETPKIDRKVVDYILVLDHKIDIEASKHVNPAEGVSEIQLFLPYNNNPLAKKMGRVEVRGTLENASTAAAVRYYTLTVYSLRFLKLNKGSDSFIP